VTAPWCTFVCIAEGADDARATVTSVEAQTSAGASLSVVPDVAAATSVISAARGWVGFLEPGATLAPGAIELVARHLEARPPNADDVDLLYTDETVRTGVGPRPLYKPDWSPDRLRCQPYLGRLAVVRAEVAAATGGVRAAFGAAAEHDLLLRVGERARAVVHVPVPLCERPSQAIAYPAFDPADITSAVTAVDEHLRRVGLAATARPHDAPGLLRLEPHLTRRPRVSIVIPTAGARRLVRGADSTLVLGCVQSVLERSTYDDVEIVAVLDATTDTTTRAALAELGPSVRIIDFDGPFHFSRKVNQGVLAASGEIIVLLNDDTEVRTPGWLEAMLLYALDPQVGAVGARLLFEDGRIQHAGVVGVAGNPGHAYHGFAADTVGHGANALVPGDFLAVTGACLMTRRSLFLAVGGLSSWFPASYNDLDYCCKVHRAGYRIVATPDAVLDHFESSSRDGRVEADELELVRRRWGRWLRSDPFYNGNFVSGVADYDLAGSAPAVNSP
jgi:GT2 family glycosyltransferase